ncbi:MAG: hypothetical protein EPO65_04065 [Dehalococcoidia bacterium]|nr:MAG: hypothetical protein EPO65_04065 [Dehalococcoidia bacterium]
MPNATWIRITLATAAIAVLVSTWWKTGETDIDAARQVLSVSGVVILLILAFDSFAWRWPLIRLLSRVPVLHGTWKAALRTSYPGRADELIECYLVVRQTYSTIRVDLLTDRARSRFVSGALVREPGAIVLNYIFRYEADALNTEGNPPSKGAADLTVGQRPALHMSGDYWMERGTKGTIQTVGHAHALYDTYDSAQTGEYEDPSA